MKKIALFLSTFCLLSSVARADFYVGAGYGLSINDGSFHENGIKSKYKDSALYSLSAGAIMPIPLFDFRAEAEYFHSRPSTKLFSSQNLDALMLNTTGVIPLIPFIDPYVGLGLGYARYNHHTSPAWQAIAGVEYAFVTNPFVLGAEYRFLKLTENGGKGSDVSKYRSHGVILKLKYTF